MNDDILLYQKQNNAKTRNKNKKHQHLSFKDSDSSHHASKLMKTFSQQKANNALDRVLKNNIDALYDDDDMFYA